MKKEVKNCKEGLYSRFTCILHLLFQFLFFPQSVHRMLDARQLGLKLIANVTFGYTAAHFSGRMPCVEVSE